MMKTKPNIHTISFLVANKPGVLVRIALVFARRGYNIDSLVVSPSADEKYSRMTITAEGDPGTLDQIIKQTSKLIDVLHVGEHTSFDAIHRELALFKVKAASTSKPAIAKLIQKYHAAIIEENTKALIIEQIGTTDAVDELEAALKKQGIVELVRSGKLVMAKGLEET